MLLVAMPTLSAAGANDPYPGVLPGDGGTVSCPMFLDSTRTLSLAQAVDIALCNNPQIRAAWINIRVQAAAVGVARAAYWPSLSVVGSELNQRTATSDSRVPSSDRTDDTVFGSLSWHLFDFGGRAATRRSAQALLAAAESSRDATLQSILEAVVQAYFNAVTAAALVDNKDEDDRLAHVTLSSAQRKQSEGGGALSDVLQAATAAARASLDRNRARGEHQKAIADLVYALGLPAGSELHLASDVDLSTGSEVQDLSAWLKSAEQRHPAIVAARAAVEAARAQVASARSAGEPSIDLTGNYYQNGFPQQGLTSNNTRVMTVGLSVTVPLFDGFVTHYKVRGAEALVKVKEAELEDTEQRTLASVVRAHADAESSFQNLSGSEALLSDARAALDSAQRRYSQGAASILELLSAQAAVADAQSERVRCLAEWRSARLRVLASTGLLNRAALQP
jgi:outer membrane protein